VAFERRCGPQPCVERFEITLLIRRRRNVRCRLFGSIGIWSLYDTTLGRRRNRRAFAHYRSSTSRDRIIDQLLGRLRWPERRKAREQQGHAIGPDRRRQNRCMASPASCTETIRKSPRRKARRRRMRSAFSGRCSAGMRDATPFERHDPSATLQQVVVHSPHWAFSARRCYRTTQISVSVRIHLQFFCSAISVLSAVTIFVYAEERRISCLPEINPPVLRLPRRSGRCPRRGRIPTG
jgi:hypothetical protein